MTQITQAPLVEYVLVRPAFPPVRFHFSCSGCAFMGHLGCENESEDPGCSPEDTPEMIWAIVPAGFSDEEVSHG